ncbi:hypothetical protein SNE40_020554 [Patella caerulea]|uniref:TIR domain-containing protein n=2 Tax=Patella caerulea TaxID=87958 RepID=A0AAN8GAQ8_PATCE
MAVARILRYVVFVIMVCCSVKAELPCTDASCLCTPEHYDRGILWLCKIRRLRENTINFERLPTNASKFLTLSCDETSKIWSALWDHMFKILPKLLVLKIENCQISQIPELAFSGLNKLEELTIKYSSISLIHENSFSSLPRLRLLEFISSGVRHLPKLCSVKTLRTLNVSHNFITSYDKTGVKCDNDNDQLPNFEVLDVSYNLIETIPLWLGNSFPKLKRLTSSDNVVSRIDSGTINNLPELMWLDLGNNSLTSIDSGMMSNCSGLVVLSLGDNPVQNLPAGLMSNHSKLVHLYLNNLSLHDDIWSEFLTLKRLEYLHLRSNLLTFVNSSVMERIPLLKELDLSNNFITQFNIFTFKDQYMLKLLNLSNNAIQVVPKQAFKLIHSLKELDMSRNNLTSFSKSAFKGLRKLKSVDLSQNKLKGFSIGVFNEVSTLQKLNLSHNILTKLPGFHEMHSLDVLDLSTNHLAIIDISTFFGLTGLVELDLFNNKIEYIPHGVFQHCQQLERLNLADNGIRQISAGGFLNLKKLNYLNLGQNNLAETVTVLSSLNSLTNLILKENSVTKIYRGQFPDAIQTLDLSYNKITYMAPFTFRTMKNLKSVRLEFNKLTSLQMQSVEIPRDVHPKPLFYISANPLQCDCSLSWLKELAESDAANVDLYPNIVDLQLLRCTSVYNSSPKFFKYVPRSDFLCSYREKCEYNCPCCGTKTCACRYECPAGCQCLISDDKTNIHKVHCENQNMTSVPVAIPYAVTDLMLDGNNFTTLPPDVFKDLENVKRLYLNNSNIHALQNASFIGLNNVEELYLNNNNITVIPSLSFPELGKLQTLYLNNNDIHRIEDESLGHLESLRILALDNNMLEVIPLNDLKQLLKNSHVSLAQNPWSCDFNFVCSFVDLLTSHSKMIMDSSDVKCTWDDDAYSISLLDDEVQMQCSSNKTDFINSTIEQPQTKGRDVHIAALVTISVATGIIFGVLILIYWKRDLIQVWCFIKYGWRVHNNTDDDDDDTKRPFDAFLSYSNRDELFVINELAPRLEHGEKKYKLCLHYRDFPIGACIAETIVRSVECSKRTVMLISDHFLQSEWCRYEFQTAHHQVLTEKKNRLILILLHDIDHNKLDSQLKLYFKTRTYLKYNDPWFWDKLYYAMPDTCLPVLERNGTIKRERLPMDDRFQRNISQLSDQILNEDMYEVPLTNHYQTIESPGNSEYTYGSSSGHYEEVHPCPNPTVITRINPPPPVPKHPPPPRSSSICKPPPSRTSSVCKL